MAPPGVECAMTCTYGPSRQPRTAKSTKRTARVADGVSDLPRFDASFDMDPTLTNRAIVAVIRDVGDQINLSASRLTERQSAGVTEG
jgi:hypothetical protein